MVDVDHEQYVTSWSSSPTSEPTTVTAIPVLDGMVPSISTVVPANSTNAMAARIMVT